jgi:hypothetical protein
LIETKSINHECLHTRMVWYRVGGEFRDEHGGFRREAGLAAPSLDGSVPPQSWRILTATFRVNLRTVCYRVNQRGNTYNL